MTMYTPISVSADPASAGANTAVQFTVTLANSPDENEAVSISSNPSSAFTNLPSSVTVLAGHNSVQFSAQTSSGFNGAEVTASANGGSANTSVLYDPNTGG